MIGAGCATYTSLTSLRQGNSLVGVLGSSQQARQTTELIGLLSDARESSRVVDGRPLPRQQAVNRAVVALL